MYTSPFGFTYFQMQVKKMSQQCVLLETKKKPRGLDFPLKLPTCYWFQSLENEDLKSACI